MEGNFDLKGNSKFGKMKKKLSQKIERKKLNTWREKEGEGEKKRKRWTVRVKERETARV